MNTRKVKETDFLEQTKQLKFREWSPDRFLRHFSVGSFT